MEALLIEDQEKSLTNRWLGLREWLKETRENLSELRECFWQGRDEKERNRVIKLVLWGTSLAYIEILKQW